jgi:hypothetical protein
MPFGVKDEFRPVLAEPYSLSDVRRQIAALREAG